MNKPASHANPGGQFTIKAVAQATGLTVETLRAWERRYEVVQPSRDGSGRRTYSASDVARLRLLRSATELGHTISRLAQLSEDELAKLVADSGGHARSAVGMRSPGMCSRQRGACGAGGAGAGRSLRQPTSWMT